MTDIEMRLNSYKNDGDILKAELLAYFKDTTFPLEKRWALFGSTPDDLLEHHSYMIEFSIEEKLGDFSWYDDFNIEKYETVEFFTLINKCEKELSSPSYYRDALTSTIKKYQETHPDENIINEWKEDILSRGICSAVNNW